MKWIKSISTGLFFLVIILVSSCKKSEPSPVTVITPVEKPSDTTKTEIRYRGFNLLGKFDVFWSNEGFPEEDFQMIKDLGFNFVRLPLDYLTYTTPGDWNSFSETDLQEIDKAVQYGKKYGIHVNICLHRAPGFSVNKTDKLPDNQKLNLWTDKIAQDAFVAHWVMFAKRYKDVSAADLSFNLVNEPTDVSSLVYANLAKRTIDSILKYNATRKVHVDALEYATVPINELVGVKNVVQAMHNYHPVQLTHYKANWIGGSDTWSVPRWPLYNFSYGLYGSGKPDLQGPFNIKGNFPSGTEVTIQVQQVSIKADFYIDLDSTVVFSHLFNPQAGVGEWSQVVSSQWGYQNIYNRDYTVKLNTSGSKLSFYIKEGDWLTFNSITIKTPTATYELLPGNTIWGIKPVDIQINNNGAVLAKDGSSGIVGSPLIDTWANFRKTTGSEIIVGECGVYNRTPHDVTLRYFEDMLKLMKQNNMSYALWNFRGGFGILDSERTDVDYEDYRGHLLDKELLDLLKKY